MRCGYLHHAHRALVQLSLSRTQSDSLGYVYKPDGFTTADLEQVGGTCMPMACAVMDQQTPSPAGAPPPLLPSPPQVMAIKSRHSGKLRDFKSGGAQYVEG